MDRPQEILQQLDQVLKYIELAHAETNAGNIVSLDEMQICVANICAEIAQLPVGEIVQLGEKLNDVSAKLSDLEVDLRAKKIEVEREIKRANNNKVAASAYEKAKLNNKDAGQNGN